MIHFELSIGDEEDEENEDDDYGWGDNDRATVVRHNEDGTKTEVGWIGGEPEDNTYYRTYSWIVGALNDAYKLGRQHGAKSEYNRLQDKV